MNNYNPYSLLSLIIDGQSIYGRPFEFDSEIADQRSMKNAFGQFVKPTKISTLCPKCGQGLFISITLPDPPFAPIHCLCGVCSPPLPQLSDPFVNPLNSGRVPEFSLDPLLYDPEQALSQCELGEGEDNPNPTGPLDQKCTVHIARPINPPSTKTLKRKKRQVVSEQSKVKVVSRQSKAAEKINSNIQQLPSTSEFGAEVDLEDLIEE